MIPRRQIGLLRRRASWTYNRELGAGSSQAGAVTSITTTPGDPTTVTVTTGGLTGVNPGDTVTISGATPGTYDGLFYVYSVLNPLRFTYRRRTNPGAYVSGGTVVFTPTPTPVTDGATYWYDADLSALATSHTGSPLCTTDGDFVRYVSDVSLNNLPATSGLTDPTMITTFLTTGGPNGGRAIKADATLTTFNFLGVQSPNILSNVRPLIFYAVMKSLGSSWNPIMADPAGSQGAWAGAAGNSNKPLVYDGGIKCIWGSSINDGLWHTVRWRMTATDTGVRVDNGVEVTGTGSGSADGSWSINKAFFGDTFNEEWTGQIAFWACFNNATSFDSAADQRVMTYLAARFG